MSVLYPLKKGVAVSRKPIIEDNEDEFLLVRLFIVFGVID